MHEPVRVMALGMELGECPLWDHRTGTLWWIDIIRCELFALDWRTDAMRRFPLPALGGGLGLLPGNRLLVAVQTGLFAFDPATETYEFLFDPEPDRPDNRLNEGKTDVDGRFWIGSICTLGRRPQGALYRIDAPGEVIKMLGGVHVPNSLAFAKDGSVSFADSHVKRIQRYRLDGATLVKTGIFVDESDKDWIPDGIALGTEGDVFSAKFGGGRVTVYGPEGDEAQVLHLTATQVTSCCFAGPQLDHLVVTTAKRLLDDEARLKQPQAGDLFIFRTGHSGVREPVCTVFE
ncbi:MAG: SMP-30/gluconolactonase/LRE family protein [Roseitalea sp.]|jgi:sugar lactone lactonase YvrE|nr:SMP-30/gluconolactonase/LRE family protein [Roseitalea sp.]MBO6721142.1 SMP-30/gluconolactonase/LRE family protein [Roseitalea sp.]MBO6744200.1 SMP-30/gluconolactonase/LRE family protein [Roseitalea sp.]